MELHPQLFMVSPNVVMRGFYLFVVLVCAFALQMHEDQKSKVNHLLHLHAL